MHAHISLACLPVQKRLVKLIREGDVDQMRWQEQRALGSLAFNKARLRELADLAAEPGADEKLLREVKKAARGLVDAQVSIAVLQHEIAEIVGN